MTNELSNKENAFTTSNIQRAGSVHSADMDYHGSIRLGLAIRRYPKITVYYLLLTTVVIGMGLDLVIVGAITGVEAFQRDYGQLFKGNLIIPAHWLALWVASTPGGMIFGNLFGGFFQDRVGRRLSLMAGSLLSGIGVAIIFFSYLPANIDGMRVMFLIGKVVQGFSIGVLKVTAMTYISETAPVALRGSALALFPAGNLLGQLIGSIVIYLINEMEHRSGYLIAFGIQWILAVAPFILSCVIPESPSFLLARGLEEKAIKAAGRLFSPRSDHFEVVKQLRLSLTEEQAITAGASYMSCFKTTNRRRTWLVIMASLYPAMFGLDLLSKASYFLQMVGMSSTLSLIMLIAGIVAGLIANLLGIWVMSRAGRRSLTLVTLSISAILWMAMGIAGLWRGQTVYYFSTAMMITVIVVCGVGVWPASYAIIGETSSLQLRAKTQAIGGMVQQAMSVIMSFVLAYIYNPDAGNLGAKTGFVFCGTCIFGVTLTWYLLPELKGRSALDIDHIFSMGLPARKFKSWNMNEASSNA